MKKARSLQFIFLAGLFICFVANSVQAQNNDSQKVTITVETKDKSGNTNTQKLIKENQNLSEAEIQKIVDDLVVENQGKDVKVNVNVEEQNAVKSDTDGSKSKIIIKRNLGSASDENDTYLNDESISPNQDTSKNKVIIIDGDGEAFNNLSTQELMKKLHINLDSLLGNMDLKIDDFKNIGKQAFLGVQPDSDQVKNDGVIIGEIVDGSAAQKAGLQKGDKIISINGQVTNTFPDLTSEINRRKPGDSLEIKFQRGNNEQSLSVILGEKEGRYLGFPGGNFDINKFNWEEGTSPDIKRFFINPDQEAEGQKDLGLNTNKPQLGVMIENNNGNGVKVTDIIEGTTAYLGGIKKGDIITSINKQKITSPDDLIDLISSMQPGQEIKLELKRDGKKQSKELVLGKQKKSNDLGTSNDRRKSKTYIFKNTENQKKINTDAPELSLKNLEIYPNPGTGQINLKFQTDTESPVSVKVIDTEGMEIFKEIYKIGSKDFDKQIQLKNIKSNTYFVRIEQDGKMKIQKIIVNK